MTAPSPTAGQPVRIWDLPTRLFHWLLALSVCGAIVTVKLGGLYMDWHVRFGQLTLGLVLFRLAWGFCGPRYARFGQFLHGPRAVLRYLKDKASAPAGHNPLGGWSVAAMLLVIGLQAGTGLFANDDILTAGPLAGRVSADVSALLTDLHGLNELVIYALIGLHLAAIAWYALVLRRGLVRPMVGGDFDAGDLPAGTPAARDDARMRIRAALLAAAIAVLVWALRFAEAPVASFY